MTLAAHFRACARNNAWSNDRLLRACAQLTREELHAPRVSFFPSLMLTLNHILRVDAYYLGELEATGRGLATWTALREREHGEIAPLAAEQLASDRRLIAYCDAQGDAALARTVGLDRGDEGVFEEALPAALEHLFAHQIHHRGQVHSMLAGTRVAPPQLDEFFLRYDEPRRRDEIARLAL
ncbi:MAG: DinB family protein [Deltaproteobacteria bacterium]|nr:DinB family protein [Deltaproteobacteria bacterium]